MTLRSTPPLKMTDVYAEFGAALSAVRFSELVKGGSYVTSNVSGGAIPTALPLAMSNFLGATAESRLTLVSATASSGSLVSTPTGNGADTRLDWTHAAASNSSSASASALITLRYRLGNPPLGNGLYLSCGNGYNGDGYYKCYSLFTSMPSANGGTEVSASQPTYGVDQTASYSGGSAELRTDFSSLVSAGPTMSNRIDGAVPLAASVSAGMEIDLQISVLHMAQNDSGFAYFSHQGTAVVYFAPSLLVMSGGIIRQELPFLVELHTAGQLDLVPP